MNIPLLLSKPARGSAAYIRREYLLYDRFDTALAAGAVNGTQAEPVGGTRTVIDTENKISITGGKISFAGGKVTPSIAGDPAVWYPSEARVLGKTLIGTTTLAGGTISGQAFGWDSGQSGAMNAEGLYFRGTGEINYYNTPTALGLTPFTNPGTYEFAVTLRAAGIFIFVDSGSGWRFLFDSAGVTTSPVYPNIQNYNYIFTTDNFRVPKQFYIPTPLQSDGMSAATTDGLGNPENNGTAGNAYTDIGTWGVAAGVRSCSVLGGGGTGNCVLATSTRNVFIEANLTRSAGSVGIRARQADASNYIQCVHDGTNVIVSQVIAGVSTTLSTTAVAYSAGATMKFIADGLTYRAFYNNTAAGSGVLPDTTSTNHGLITNHIGATFGKLVIWPRGNEGQHEALSLL